jgi:hypothetical protein
MRQWNNRKHQIFALESRSREDASDASDAPTVGKKQRLQGLNLAEDAHDVVLRGEKEEKPGP